VAGTQVISNLGGQRKERGQNNGKQNRTDRTATAKCTERKEKKNSRYLIDNNTRKKSQNNMQQTAS
jgi:hypothetical protein